MPSKQGRAGALGAHLEGLSAGASPLRSGSGDPLAGRGVPSAVSSATASGGVSPLSLKDLRGCVLRCAEHGSGRKEAPRSNVEVKQTDRHIREGSLLSGLSKKDSDR